MHEGRPSYCIDSSALIDWWEYYAPDVFPDLLPLMEVLVSEGRLRAVRYVNDEIQVSDDRETLAKWCRRQAGFYVDDDEAIQYKVREIMARFQVPKRPRRIANTDPFVIARVAQNGSDWHVVSSKWPENGNAHRNPNIPFVCREMGVLHIRFLDMLRAERWRLS